MPSPAERPRRGAEHALRAVTLLILAVLVWRSVRPDRPEWSVVAEVDAELESSAANGMLARWSNRPGLDSAHLSFRAAPGPVTLAWLDALRRSGTVVTWSDAGVVPLAVAAEPVPDPRGRWRLSAAGPDGVPVKLEDAAGEIATAHAQGGGLRVSLGAVVGPVAATVKREVARTVPAIAAPPRPVLVLGLAGWEAKFVIAALEERGWTVHAKLALAPGVAVTHGTIGTLDTGSYAAVVALDTSAAALSGAIARFVRAGGGLVLAGASANVPALARLAAGPVGPRVGRTSPAVPDSAPRRALTLLPILRLASDAIPLELREARIAAAARREAAGRVVQIGYDDSWRWRMTGGDGSVEAHQEWWSSLVTSVAHAPAPLVTHRSAVLGAAPLAQLVDALGPAESTRDEAAQRHTAEHEPWPPSLAVALFLTLLVEWGSRRLRGSR